MFLNNINMYRTKLSKKELNFFSNVASTVNEATVRMFDIASDAIWIRPAKQGVIQGETTNLYNLQTHTIH